MCDLKCVLVLVLFRLVEFLSSFILRVESGVMFVCLLWCDTALTSSLASHSSIICAVSPLTCRLRMSRSSWLPWSASSTLRASVSWRTFRAGSPWGGTFGCVAHWEVWCWSWPPRRTRALNRPSPILPVRQQKLKSSHLLEGSSLLLLPLTDFLLKRIEITEHAGVYILKKRVVIELTPWGHHCAPLWLSAGHK